MKNPILLVALFYSTLICCQDFKLGIYYTANKDISFTSEIFEFKINQQFNYSIFGCTGSGFGSGEYELVNDTLNLRFTDKLGTLQRNVKLEKTDSDSLKIRLQIFETYSKYPLPGVKCNLDKEEANWQSDFDGFVEFNLPRINRTRILKFSYVGFGTTEIRIPPDIGKVSGIIRMGNIYYYNSEDVMKFKVKRIGKSRFTLMSNDSYFITYRKISRKRASEVILDRTDENYEAFFDNN
ncbi:hypothetical protein ACFQ1M_06295 [Sungkyunkwania multivorans]|uniref:Uncharacterized protein n=1 Tax=Sungkyunkwania multivorans TaxID=1173618 RepID=A0ABW3CXE6_9FLAO